MEQKEIQAFMLENMDKIAAMVWNYTFYTMCLLFCAVTLHFFLAHPTPEMVQGFGVIALFSGASYLYDRKHPR
jgi:hypothetical protein